METDLLKTEYTAHMIRSWDTEKHFPPNWFYQKSELPAISANF